MPIIRHRYTKIEASSPEPVTGKFEINSAINFTELDKQKTMSGDASSGFTITYDFSTKYNKDKASVRVKGEVLYVAPKKEADEIESTWKEKKVLPEQTVLQVGNFCLMKAQMKAIELANGVDLQAPVRLPKFQPKK